MDQQQVVTCINEITSTSADDIDSTKLIDDVHKTGSSIAGNDCDIPVDHILSQSRCSNLNTNDEISLMEEDALLNDQSCESQMADEEIVNENLLLMDDEEILLNEDPQHMDDEATLLNENPQHMDDEVTLLNENPKHMDDEAILLNENSHMEDEATLLNENLQQMDDEVALSNEKPQQMDDETTLMNENPQHMDDETTLLNESSSCMEDESSRSNTERMQMTDDGVSNESSLQTEDTEAKSSLGIIDELSSPTIDEQTITKDNSPIDEESSLNENSSITEEISIVKNDSSKSVDKLLEEDSLLVSETKLNVCDEEILLKTDTIINDATVVNNNSESNYNNKSFQISFHNDNSLLQNDIAKGESLETFGDTPVVDNNCATDITTSKIHTITSHNETSSTEIIIDKSNDNISTDYKTQENADEKPCSQQEEILSANQCIISGVSQSPEKCIKQEVQEMNYPQALADNQLSVKNNKDMLNTEGDCDRELDEFNIKEELLENADSQDANRIEQENQMPQILSCESLKGQQVSTLVQEGEICSEQGSGNFSSVKEEILEPNVVEETMGSDVIVKTESMDVDIKEECNIADYDSNFVKEENAAFFDDGLQNPTSVNVILNNNQISDFENVVPVALKSNSEFQNGMTPDAMEEEIIVPSSDVVNSGSFNRGRKRKIVHSDAVDEKRFKESDSKDVAEVVDNLLSPRRFECPICHKKYQYIASFERHEKTHSKAENTASEISFKSGIYSCSCGKGFRRQSTAQACLKTHRKICFTCQWCTLIFKKQIDLRNHCKLKHSSHLRPKYICVTCKKTFSGKRNLSRHTKIHVKELKKAEAAVKRKKKVVAKNPEVINLDSEDSLDKTQLPCELCNAKCSSQRELRKHLFRVHPVKRRKIDLRKDEKKPPPVKFKFTCRICRKGYSTLGALTTHNKVDHKPRKPKASFQCERCGEGFPTRSEVSSHRRLHCRGVVIVAPPPSPPPPMHKCDVCDLSFRTLANMTSHRETHPFVTFATDDNTSTKIFFK